MEEINARKYSIALGKVDEIRIIYGDSMVRLKNPDLKVEMEETSDPNALFPGTIKTIKSYYVTNWDEKEDICGREK